MTRRDTAKPCANCGANTRKKACACASQQRHQDKYAALATKERPPMTPENMHPVLPSSTVALLATVTADYIDNQYGERRVWLEGAKLGWRCYAGTDHELRVTLEADGETLLDGDAGQFGLLLIDGELIALEVDR